MDATFCSWRALEMVSRRSFTIIEARLGHDGTSLHVIPEGLSCAGHTSHAGWAGGGCWAAARDVSLGEVAAALLLACCLLSAHCLLSACCSSWCIFQLHMGKDGLRGRTKPPLDLFQHPHEVERTEQLLMRSIVHQLPTILSSKPGLVPAQPPFDSSGPFRGMSGFLRVGDNFQQGLQSFYNEQHAPPDARGLLASLMQLFPQQLPHCLLLYA